MSGSVLAPGDAGRDAEMNKLLPPRSLQSTGGHRLIHKLTTVYNSVTLGLEERYRKSGHKRKERLMLSGHRADLVHMGRDLTAGTSFVRSFIHSVFIKHQINSRYCVDTGLFWTNQSCTVTLRLSLQPRRTAWARKQPSTLLTPII